MVNGKARHIYTLLIILISMYKAEKIVDNSKIVTGQKAQFVALLLFSYTQEMEICRKKPDCISFYLFG